LEMSYVPLAHFQVNITALFVRKCLGR